MSRKYPSSFKLVLTRYVTFIAGEPVSNECILIVTDTVFVT